MAAGTGYVVVVTGASRGIGYSVGKELATRMPGAHLYLTTRNAGNIQNLESTLKRDIGTASEGVSFRMLDVHDKRSICKFVEVVKRKHQRL